MHNLSTQLQLKNLKKNHAVPKRSLYVLYEGKILISEIHWHRKIRLLLFNYSVLWGKGQNNLKFKVINIKFWKKDTEDKKLSKSLKLPKTYWQEDDRLVEHTEPFRDAFIIYRKDRNFFTINKKDISACPRKNLSIRKITKVCARTGLTRTDLLVPLWITTTK